MNNFMAMIKGYKDTKLVRHYTTLNGILGILKDGYIKPHESRGDNDWSYDYIDETGIRRSSPYLLNKKVVSLLDSENDIELLKILNANKNSHTIEGQTYHLGLHDSTICCCIEIYLDELETTEGIHLLSVFDKDANIFIDWFNNVVDEIDNKTGYIGGFIKYQYLFDEFQKLSDEDKSKLRYSEFNTRLDNWLDKYLGKCKNGFDLENRSILKRRINRDFNNYDEFKDSLECINEGLSELFKLKLRRISESDRQRVLDYISNWDWKSVLKLFNNHGYDVYKKNGEWNGFYPFLECPVGKFKWYLNYILKPSNPYRRIPLEIRSLNPIKIDKRTSRILVFQGILDAMKKEGNATDSQIDNLNSYSSKYNIVVIPAGSDQVPKNFSRRVRDLFNSK